MVYAMACADENYMPSAKFQLNTALKKGKVDKTLCYNIAGMDKEFMEKNDKILSSGEGTRRGHYLWKPYFVNKALLELKQGDYLIYLDRAGFYYRSTVASIISYMGGENIDMVGSRRNSYLEKHWTKRDVFVYIKYNAQEYTNQVQAMGGCFISKKTERTHKIIQEWLQYAQDYRIISDAPNTCGLDNYEGFVENRHNQSILSILMKKYNVINIENLPIADFYVYHHTRETSIRRIKVELCRRMLQIKKCLAKKNLKGVYYIERERIKNVIWVQKMLRRKVN